MEIPSQKNNLSGFIITNNGMLPSPEEVLKISAALGEPDLKFDDQNSSESTGVHIYQHPMGILSVMHVDFPHPDALHMPLGFNSPTPEEIKGTNDHLITSFFMNENVNISLKNKVLMFARLTAAISYVNDAVGVMLGQGIMFLRPEKLIKAITKTPENSVPLPGGIDFFVEREKDGRYAILTHGMPLYGREDLYVVASAKGKLKDAYRFSKMMIHWMLTTDKVFPDGDTIGRTADEKIVILRVKNPMNSNAFVIKLDILGQKPMQD